MDKENNKNNDNDEIIFEEIIAGKSKSSKKDNIIFEEAVAGKSNLPEDKNIPYKNVITGREIFPNNKLPTQSNRVYPPLDYDKLNQQRILENFYSNLQLSNEDKKVLYPKIIDHLDKLWREGGNSVEYVQRHACEDSEIDNIMKTSWIVITEEKRRQIVKRIELIFLAKYRFEYFYENLKSLKESSPEKFDKIVKDILEIDGELKLATGKELYQLHSDFERDKKRIEQKQLNKVQKDIFIVKKDIFIVKEDIDLIGDKEREEIKFRAENLFNSGLPTKKDYILFYFGEEIKLLDDNEIIKLAEDYENKFDAICVDFAEKLKDLIVNEYGGKILNMKEVPLTSIFSFDLGRRIRKVKQRENIVLSLETLNQIKNEINNYRFSQNTDLQKYCEKNYKKIFDFIDKHIEFSKFIKQKASGIKIIDPRLADGTNNLELRSWLIENLRFIFPKKFELPIDNNLLSWFIFGDTSGYGEQSKINVRLWKAEIGKRFYIRDLLGIDWRVFNLTTNDFKEKELDISQKDLDNLRKKVSYLIYNYIFFKNHDIPYVSNTTNRGINVGIEYWTPEYFLIRAVFFVVAESNQGLIKSFEEIGTDLNMGDLKHYLAEGFGFGNSLPNIVSYIENLYVHRLLNSNVDVFKMAFLCLEEYDVIYFLRAKNCKNLFSPFDSKFEKDVNDFLLNISPLFVHQKSVVEAIGKRMISLSIVGNKIFKRIHYAFHYDFYLKLDDKIRKCLGLDDQWKGIAIEANGIYWHSEDREQDLLKKAIAKAENIILVVIWDNMDASVWLTEIVRQINEQAHSNLREYTLLHLNNCY